MPQTFQRLPLGAVRPAGWLRDQLLHDLEHGFASRLDSLTARAAHDLFVERIESSAEQYAWWDAETRGNWLWGYTLMAFLSGQVGHKARVEQLLRALLATQDADGYIGIYAPHARYQHGNGENGELWAQSRALLALLAYYEFTGNAEVLGAVERAARLTMSHYGEGHSYFRTPSSPLTPIIGVTHGLCYVDVMAWLYAITADTAYRDFGVWLYDDFCALPVPFANDDLSTRSLMDVHRPLGGHAVHTAEHLRVLAWAAAVTGRADLRQALEAAQTKFSRFILPSGALIGDESLHGMPLPEIGYEYCTLTEYLASLTDILEQCGTGGDDIERLVFNAAQGARLPDGSGVAYLSQDTRLDARSDRPDSYSFFHGGAGRFKFSPTHEDIACCCNPNATRLLPHYISHQWMRHNEGVAALLYGACELHTEINGVNVQIDEIADYPFEETIRFVICPERPVTFRLSLRQPAWSPLAHVTVNGESVSAATQANLITLDRCWSPGDEVSVTFTAPIEILPYPNGEYAVRRGALQYVLPIELELHPIKQYAGSTLVDLNIVPKRKSLAYRTVFLDGGAPQFGLTFERTPDSPDWHHVPTRLNGSDFALVPIGCALLRRSAFPLLQGEP